MREIKFRGKRIDTGEWIYGHYVEQFAESTCFETLGPYIYVLEKDNTVMGYEVHPDSVGMSTGLKDKKKKPIYESDIFKSLGLIGIIKYFQGCWVIDWTIKPNALTDKLYPHTEEGEVIGNIHENPELLK